MLVNVQTVTGTLKKIKPITLFTGIVLIWIYQTSDAGLTQFLQSMFRSPEGTPNWVWGFALISVLLNLIFPLLIAYWILSQLRKSVTWKNDFQQVVIEYLRSYGHILAWTFLFILPGIWKWLSYCYVPYVVLFSKKYQNGEVDALKHSSALFRKTWWKVIPVILFFSFILPLMITTGFDQYRIIWETPVNTLLLGLVEFGFLLISLVLIYTIFFKSIHEVNDELIF